MKTLRKKSFKSMIFPIIIFALLTALFLALGIDSLIPRLKADFKTLDSLDYSENLSGTYIKDNLYGIYDYFCETTSGSKTVSREYLIDAGDSYYIGMYAEGSDMKKADALMEASWDYLDGKDDGTALEGKQFEIVGTIKSMPYDSLKYYKEYLGWSTMSEAEKATFLPYYIVVGEIDGSEDTDMIMWLLIGGVFLFFTIFYIVSLCTGRYQKSVKKYIAASPNPDMAREKVEHFLNSTADISGIRISNEFICGQNGAKTTFGELRNLVWAYEHVTTHRTNFVVTGKTYQVVIGFKDGKKHFLGAKNEEAALEILQNIGARAPHVILGYNADLEKAFTKDMNSFLQIRYNEAIAQQGMQDAYGNDSAF